MRRGMENFDYDVVVIGSGVAGMSAAQQLANAGKTVALAEKSQYLGGECSNYSGVPTKALLHSAKIYRDLREAQNFGLFLGGNLDYTMIKAQKDYIVSQTGARHTDKESLKEAGIDLIRGEAKFIDKNTISIAGKEITAQDFIIATGSKNRIPAIAGLDKIPYLTSQTIVDLAKLPESILIVGAGPVGVEFAQLFISFGVDVALLEFGSRILPNEEPEVSKEVAKSLEDQGVEIIIDFKAEKIEGDAEHITLFGINKVGEIDFSAQKILIATGRIPNVDSLDLESAGVLFDQNKLKVNKYLRTNKKNIWVVGDASGNAFYTATAKYGADILVKNILGEKNACDFRVVPRTVSSDPPVASVGELETNIKDEVVVGMTKIHKLANAMVNKQEYGLVKIVANKKTGEILGAGIACPGASEMIHEIALAMSARLTVYDIANTIHAFPTYSEAIKLAAQDTVDQLED